jgi:hypothetical protein
VGVGGVAAAITAVFTALPAPAAGGTCGPGRTSEAALFAFFDPASIGAGAQPAVTNATAHSQWLAFVGECQSATDARILTGLFVLIVALLLLAAGVLLSRRSAWWGGGPTPPTEVRPASGPSSSGDPRTDPAGDGRDDVRVGDPFPSPPDDEHDPLAVPVWAGAQPAIGTGDPPTREIPVGAPPG